LISSKFDTNIRAYLFSEVISMAIKTYAALILDKSGSMGNIRDFAINSFNEQIQTLKAESDDPKEITKKLLKSGKQATEGVETYLTLVSFNDNVRFHVFNEDIKNVKEFPTDEYKPDGSTALFDAIGETIDRFTSEIPGLNDPDSGALLVIVTDGQENASKGYGGEEGRKKLKSRIEELQNSGKWTITFVGAEKVLETAVNHLGLHAGNVRAASMKDQLGWIDLADSQTIGTKNYMSARRQGHRSMTSYYDSNKKDEEDSK
jgi:hypothetical protein